MKNLCKPFKDCTPQQLTQGYSDKHRAFDFASTYGKYLVAMENCIVENIIKAENWDNQEELERGYGVLLRSIENPTVKYSYWHCLPFFCVEVGDTVSQGQPVSQMGNSGFCMSGGIVVPLNDRSKPPYYGTHVHLSCPENTLERIDWSIPIKFDLLTTISLTIKSIINFLK